MFIGINPGLRSAAAGHHYAGPGNHFWPLLFESGLVSERLTAADDARVLESNIGLTNMVARSSPGIADLALEELREGARVLRTKLLKFQPKVACFNGKRIYEVFSGKACKLGLQDETLGSTLLYVMPSTSPRGASYQRGAKLGYFKELRSVVDGVKRKAAAAS